MALRSIFRATQTAWNSKNRIFRFVSTMSRLSGTARSLLRHRKWLLGRHGFGIIQSLRCRCPTAALGVATSTRTCIFSIHRMIVRGLDVCPREIESKGSDDRDLAMPLSQSSARGLIDVHHHIVPPFYLAGYRDHIAGSRGGEVSAAWLEWTPDHSLRAMDTHGVEMALVSLSTPGVWLGDARSARDISRRCNEYAADLCRLHPGRFGRFATVPLPDVEGSLREIEYACDVLQADGVGVLTSYGDRWLGDLAYAEVFDELNRRKAVVFVHPTTPSCCQNLMPGIAPLIAEVPQDTTRAIINMLFSGTFVRNRDIRFIFTHAGGTLPMVAGRIAHYGPPQLSTNAPNGLEHELRRLY